jgi:hypothetical protein
MSLYRQDFVHAYTMSLYRQDLAETYRNNSFEHVLQLCDSLGHPCEVGCGLHLSQLGELCLVQEVEADDLGFGSGDLDGNGCEHGTGRRAWDADRNTGKKIRLHMWR